MAQTGFTPISNYYSATASAVPTAGNLVAGELAINTADGKLFYKDSAGVVQTMASKAGNVNVSSFSGGTTGLTPSTATTGAVTLAGTLAVANGGTGVTTSTGSGANVLGTSPTITNPALGGATSGSVTLAVPAVAGSNTATLPAATGTVMVSGNMPAFNVYANTNQTISNATVTKVALQARTFDTASAFDITTNYRFQPLVAGYYQLNGQVQYTGTVITYNVLIFYKNGSEVARGALGGGTTTYGANGSCLVYLNGSTDYMEMYVQQNSGGNLTLNSTSFYVQFSGAMVRAA